MASARLKKEGKTINSLIEGLSAPLEAKEFRIKISTDDFVALGTQVLEDMDRWVAETDGLELELPNYEGIRVNYKLEDAEGWFLLRKSLHDPVLPLNIESNTEGGVEKAYSLIKTFLGQYEGLLLP